MRDVVENERKGYERGGREKEKERGVVESERREKCETVNEQRWQKLSERKVIEKERVTKSERMGKAETERKIIESEQVRIRKQTVREM